MKKSIKMMCAGVALISTCSLCSANENANENFRKGPKRGRGEQGQEMRERGPRGGGEGMRERGPRGGGEGMRGDSQFSIQQKMKMKQHFMENLSEEEQEKLKNLREEDPAKFKETVKEMVSELRQKKKEERKVFKEQIEKYRSSTKEEQIVLKEKIREDLKTQFYEKLDNLKKSFEENNKKLNEFKEKIETRENNADAIIDEKLDDILRDPNLSWK